MARSKAPSLFEPEKPPARPVQPAQPAEPPAWRVERRIWTGDPGAWLRGPWEEIKAGTEAACRKAIATSVAPTAQMIDLRLWHKQNIVLQVTR